VSVEEPPRSSRVQAGFGRYPDFQPGDPGIGDPYFPLGGNEGYDTQHYDLTFSYDPATDRLEGPAVITAKATQDLSRFDLDLQQLDVDSVTVNLQQARYSRDGQELQITPRRGIREDQTFVVTIRYGGIPQTIVGSPIVFGSPYGFLHTDDGAFMGDEPNVASTWFPVSDHPQDKAKYTFRVSVPKGLGVVANGTLKYHLDIGQHSLWVWDEPLPMASYLVTADIGRWNIRQGRTPGGILKTWTAKYRYGTATTADFIALSEQISGLDLESFFHVWLDVPAKPTTW
jgi:aminopeptidase N